MAKYTFAQLVKLWTDVGGSVVAAPFAAAIALAESGGDSSSTNRNGNGTTDRGLWQINSIHGGLSTTDPMANARAAVQISKNGTNWRPWCVAWSDGKCGGTFLGATAPVFRHIDSSTYTGTTPTGGSVNPVGAVPVPLPNGGSLNVPIPGIPDVTGGISGLLQSLASSMFMSAVYFVVGGAGLVLFIVGLGLLFSETKTANVLRGAAGKAFSSIPQTAVAGKKISDDADRRDRERASEQAERDGVPSEQ